ncbi:Exosome complex exonuclease RRP42 [Holothuria leucospilota]|uniref:Ribosomal RNA-processing protein 42 n=1 Tax=Holothuria leucospilota TaxID=206669 RepID=A0A9Q1CBD4_HOLLE|nr:Exosome complex exonuclease RRP42 [Holothuria leucospilota]
MASTQLSDGEKTFIIHGVLDNLRNDGRTCENYRQIEVECGVVSNTSGSSRLRLSNTEVLVGIKAEMGQPKPQSPKTGFLEFFVDFSANASPEFEGRGGNDLSEDMSTRFAEVFQTNNILDFESLCIIPGQCCWVLYIDIVLLECGGNLLDAMSLAVKAALANTRIPKVTVLRDSEGGEDIEVSDDPDGYHTLEISKVPLFVTLSKIGQKHVVDATLEEEACCSASLVVSVNSSGDFTGMVKKGSSSLSNDSIHDMLVTAKKVGIQLHKGLDTLLSEVGQSTAGRGFLVG